MAQSRLLYTMKFVFVNFYHKNRQENKFPSNDNLLLFRCFWRFVHKMQHKMQHKNSDKHYLFCDKTMSFLHFINQDALKQNRQKKGKRYTQ